MSQKKDTRARILIVEDELIIAQNLKFRLEKLGYGVTNITIDAEETRMALKEEVPDLVLMDIALYGGNDGVILAKWIDKNYKIPVIYVTSHTDSSTFERASKSMPYGYLIKPFNPKELYNAIELALQRHQLLLQLSNNSSLLGFVLQSIGDSIIVVDKSKNILFMNESAEHLLESGYDTVRNMNIEELLPFKNPGDELIPEKWNLANVPESGEVEFESQLKTKNRTAFLQVRLSHLNSEKNPELPTGYLIIIRDITLRKKTEDIFIKIASAVSGEIGDAFLKTLTERLTKTLETDYCYLGAFHEKTPNVCTVAEFCSRVRSSIDNITALPIAGSPIEVMIKEKSTVCYENNVHELFPDDQPLNEGQIKGFVGTPLISSDGTVAGVIIIMSRSKLENTEILKSVLQIFANRATAELERKLYEKKLITERNRANEMNALKTNFLSNLSHEVRTPLNSIIGFSSLLGEELNNKEQLEFLGFIEEAGQRLLQTINDLLDISILESEPEKITSRKINLESDVIETIGMMSNIANDKKLVLDYSINSKGVLVKGDPRMTGQVIRKLIGNALKFTEEGSVFIEIDYEKRKEGDFGVVRVHDTGVGIEANFLPFVFDEFKQESQGIARKFEGVGLGLAIAKKMTDLMGGVIEVESTKGKGSVFSLYLPFAGNTATWSHSDDLA